VSGIEELFPIQRAATLTQAIHDRVAHQRRIVSCVGHTQQTNRRKRAITSSGEKVTGRDRQLFIVTNRRARPAPERGAKRPVLARRAGRHTCD
jgi:hypothetical protein